MDLDNISKHFKFRFTKYFFVSFGLFGCISFLCYFFDYRVSIFFREFVKSSSNNEIIQQLMDIFRSWGKTDALVIVALVVGICGWKNRAKKVLLALLIVGILVWPLKLYTGKIRPDGSDNFSFPSGDVASITAFTVPYVVSNAHYLHVSLGIIAAVTAGRLYEGKHYLSDTAAGIALGVFCGWIAASVRRWPKFLRVSRSLWLLALFGMLIIPIIRLFILEQSPAIKEFFLLFLPTLLFLLIESRLKIRFKFLRNRHLMKFLNTFKIYHNLVGWLIFGWIIPVLIILITALKRLPYSYLFLIFPILIVSLIFLFKPDNKQFLLIYNRDCLNLRGMFFSFIGFLGGALFIFLPWLLPVSSIRIPTSGLGILLVIIVINITSNLRKKKYFSVFGTAVLGVVIKIFYFSLFIIPNILKM